MLNAINSKILLAILAALTVIGGAAIYQRDQAAKTAAAATKAAQILQLQKDRLRLPEAGKRGSSETGRGKQETAQFRRGT